MSTKTAWKNTVTTTIDTGGALTAAEMVTVLHDLANSIFWEAGGFGSLTEEDLVNLPDDYMIYYDTSAGALRRTDLANLLRMNKAPVVAASTANVTLASDVENGDTLDGVTLSTGDRILLKNQSTASENGIYIVAASGAPTRANDLDNSYNAITGCRIYVSGGTANDKKIFTLTSTGTLTVDTDDLDFEIVLGNGDELSNINQIFGGGTGGTDNIQINGGDTAGTGEGAVIQLFDKDATGGSADFAKIFAGSTNNGHIEFLTGGSGTPRVVIDENGKVECIGDIVAGEGATGTINLDVANETIADGESRRLRVRCTHNSLSRASQLGVYTHAAITNAVSYLQMEAEDGIPNYLWVDNSDILRISTNLAHTGTTSGTVVGDQTSDERIKNIQKFEYGLKEVLKLTPIAFSYKDDEEKKKRLGFSAQELKEVIPEAVYNTGESKMGIDNILAMDANQLVPVLLNAVKELSDKVDALSNECK